MKIPDIIKNAARYLRQNMTQSEQILWEYLRYDKLGIRFYRQKPLFVYTENNGLHRFIIPDFYCSDKKIIIEIDGGVHNNSEVIDLDKVKEDLIKNRGIKILRYTNESIKNNIDEVIFEIKKQLQ